MARYWSIDTAATAVQLSPHLSAITKLAAALLGGQLVGGSVLPAQYCPCGAKLDLTEVVREWIFSLLRERSQEIAYKVVFTL